ncbi:MAG: hydrogenase expression/formation protein HypE [Bacteroidales bacterium]|nr:hydrogenase expression/formation protein HypE [Bacteroidales bacterium]
MKDKILLGHGSGGKMSADLIKNIFVKNFSNSVIEALTDSAILSVGTSSLAFTTDSYVVDPVFFPGGNIGKLAVCGTVNDLAVSGAEPLYLSASFIIEEGFLIKDLETIVLSMKDEACEAGVSIVTGDTKVVKKRQCDKLFITTSGIGILEPKNDHIATGSTIKAGDKIIVNGYLGDHSAAVLMARNELNVQSSVISDVAPLNGLIKNAMAGNTIRFMRDITRGGLATILAEIVENHNFGIRIYEEHVPVRQEVKGLCEIFGFDPLYMANEGKLVAVVSPDSAESVLKKMRNHKYGKHAAIIGEITKNHPGKTVMESIIGGNRIIDKLAGEQLPRIC